MDSLKDADRAIPEDIPPSKRVKRMPKTMDIAPSDVVEAGSWAACTAFPG
jgi:hypothetical protein